MRRALQVLRVLGKHHEHGLSVKEVVEQTQLERSTAHRLLTCLVEEHFADRDTSSRRYRLGLEAMRLGFASLRRAPLVASYEPLLQRLARISEDTVFLLVRQGDYTVCLRRETARFQSRFSAPGWATFGRWASVWAAWRFWRPRQAKISPHPQSACPSLRSSGVERCPTRQGAWPDTPPRIR